MVTVALQDNIYCTNKIKNYIQIWHMPNKSTRKTTAKIHVSNFISEREMGSLQSNVKGLT